MLWILAAIAALAALFSRAIDPALPGLWVGIDHVITAIKLAGAVTSQLFAVASTAVVIGLVLATVKSALPAYLRAFSVGAGVLTVLAVMIAAAVNLPEPSRLVLAATTATITFMCVLLSARLYTLRAASICLGSVAFAGAVRVITIIVASYLSGADAGPLATLARVTATLSSAGEMAAVLVATVWLGTRPRPLGGASSAAGRIRPLLLGAVLLGGGGLTALVVLGSDPEAGKPLLLVARAFTELMSNPAPYTPELVRVFVEALRWCVVIAALAVRPRGAMMAAAVAYGLVAAGTLEAPLCAVSLVIGALVLALHPGPDLRGEG